MVNKDVLFKALCDCNRICKLELLATGDSPSMERVRLLNVTFASSLNGTHVCTQRFGCDCEISLSISTSLFGEEFKMPISEPPSIDLTFTSTMTPQL